MMLGRLFGPLGLLRIKKVGVMSLSSAMIIGGIDYHVMLLQDYTFERDYVQFAYLIFTVVLLGAAHYFVVWVNKEYFKEIKLVNAVQLVTGVLAVGAIFLRGMVVLGYVLVALAVAAILFTRWFDRKYQQPYLK